MKIVRAFAFLAPMLLSPPAFGQSFSGPANITQPTVPGHCAEIAPSGGNNLADAGAACNAGADGFPIILGSTSVAADSTTLTISGLTLSAPTLTTPAISSPTITGSLTATELVTNADLVNPATTVAGATCALGSTCGLSWMTNSVASDVSLSNTSNYFDGPSVAQGSTGTWCAQGTVTVDDSGALNAIYLAKLWDGTTVLASTSVEAPGTSAQMTVSLSGCLASPAGNLRISVRDASSTSGLILANSTGVGKTSTVTVQRVN